MDLSNLCKLSADEILKGSFGIEWESLRAYSDGKLSLTPHPEVFGDKLKNPLVTTDFSESQIEIITPTFNTIDEAFDNPHHLAASIIVGKTSPVLIPIPIFIAFLPSASHFLSKES